MHTRGGPSSLLIFPDASVSSFVFLGGFKFVTRMVSLLGEFFSGNWVYVKMIFISCIIGRGFKGV